MIMRGLKKGSLDSDRREFACGSVCLMESTLWRIGNVFVK